MRRLLLTTAAVLLCVFSAWWPTVHAATVVTGPAATDGAGRDTDVTWAPVATVDAFSYYLDPGSIAKTGARVRLWALFDHREEQDFEPWTKPFLSVRLLMEFDCKDEKARIVDSIAFAASMGRGDPVPSRVPVANQDPWESIKRSSVATSLWREACLRN